MLRADHRTTMACSTVSVFLLILSTAQSLSNSLNGEHFRLGYLMAFRPNVTEAEVSNTSVHFDNIHAYFVDWASRRNNFTVEYIVLNKAAPLDETYGQFKAKNLNWIVSNFGLARGRNADILTPHTFDRLCAIIPSPRREPNVWSFVLPYTTTVWLCFFVVMAVMIILLKLFTSATLRIHGNRPETFLSWTSSVSFVFGVATNQGGSCPSKTHSVRVVAALWCLAALVMVNAYSGSLVTYMTLPKTTPLLKSVEDLPTRPDLNILAYTNAYAGEIIKNSTLYKPVIDKYLQFPSNFCGTRYSELSKCFSLVKGGGHVYVAMGWEASVALKLDYESTKTCDLSRTEQSSETFYATYLIPLGSPHKFRNTLDVSLLEATSYGLFQYWLADYRRPYCQRSSTINQSMSKLTLVDYSSAFVILAIGTTLGIVAFAAEWFLLKKHKGT